MPPSYGVGHYPLMTSVLTSKLKAQVTTCMGGAYYVGPQQVTSLVFHLKKTLLTPGLMGTYGAYGGPYSP